MPTSEGGAFFLLKSINDYLNTAYFPEYSPPGWTIFSHTKHLPKNYFTVRRTKNQAQRATKGKKWGRVTDRGSILVSVSHDLVMFTRDKNTKHHRRIWRRGRGAEGAARPRPPPSPFFFLVFSKRFCTTPTILTVL